MNSYGDVAYLGEKVVNENEYLSAILFDYPANFSGRVSSSDEPEEELMRIVSS
jgi:hypothetical protein